MSSEARLYLDHDASAPLVPVARELLARALTEAGGNPSSVHAEGRASRRRLEEARERLAAALHAPRDAVVFTSGGTEAVALGLGAAAAGSVIAVLATEHPALRAGAEARGRALTWPVDAAGRARWGPGGPGTPPEGLAASRPALLAASLANHETGTLQDGPSLARAARALEAPLLLDACQAVGRSPVSFADLGADLLALAGHKLGGPPGIGALLVGDARPEPVLHGGAQEDGLRAGTAAAWLAPAFAAVVEEAVARLDERTTRWRALRARLLAALGGLEAELVVNSPDDGLPNTLNVSFPGRPGPALVRRLDLEGVAVSHGAACASGSSRPSPVLLAMGLGEERARSSLRVSLGPEHVERDVDRFVHALCRTLHDVRVRDR